MASKSDYPDEVWNTLRMVWEHTPKISIKDLIALVGERLGCEMPSVSAVSARKLNYKWKKVNLSSKRGKKSTNDKGSGANSFGALQVANQESVLDKVNAVADEVIANVSTKNKCIKQHRSRYKMLGDVADDVISVLQQISPDNVHEMEPEAIQRNIVATNACAQTLDMLTKAAERLFKGDAILYGIKPEDMEENKSSSRSADLKQLEAMTINEKERVRQSRSALLERVGRLEQMEELDEDLV